MSEVIKKCKVCGEPRGSKAMGMLLGNKHWAADRVTLSQRSFAKRKAKLKAEAEAAKNM